MKKLAKKFTFLLIINILSFSILSCSNLKNTAKEVRGINVNYNKDITQAYEIVNNNIASFTQDEIDRANNSFEQYGELDELGRCTSCIASISTDIMPTSERKSIGNIKPSGWQSIKYDIVEGKYLFNRCHLIGYQLSAENDNKNNLITGTRYLNVNGMLQFENIVADYIKETNNHVLYRATPNFKDKELVARGVYLEAYSVEDNGEGIQFNVYCYNIQPGVSINYLDGTSKLNEDYTYNESETNKYSHSKSMNWVVNKSTKKFHFEHCPAATRISKDNKREVRCSYNELVAGGYTPCKQCRPDIESK